MKFLKVVLLIILSVLCGYYAGEIFLRAVTTISNSDFHVYYYIPKAVLLLKRPEHPYANLVPLFPYFFPPASIILFRVILFFPFYISKFLWTLMNFFLLASTVHLIFKTFNLKNTILYLGIFLLTLITTPSRFTIEDGQFNLVLLFILSYSFYALSTKKNQVIPGILLGLGTITKVSPFLLAIYSLYHKKYLTFLISILTIIVFSISAEIFIRPGINFYYVRNVLSKVSTQAHENFWTDQSLLGLLKNYEFHTLKLTNSHIEIRPELVRTLLSYLIVFTMLTIFVFSEKYKNRNPVNTEIGFLLLTVIGVVGTGLTWFHQYIILFLPLIGTFIIGLKYFKKPWMYLNTFICTIVYLSWAFWLKEAPLPLPFLQKNMFIGAVVLIFWLFLIKLNRSFYSQETLKLNETSQNKLTLISFVSAIIIFVVTLNPLTINQRIKESRDMARIKHINYMGSTLDKFSLKFKSGSSNSYEKTEKLDEGYILLEKGQDSILRQNLSILFLDPINNQEYNYSFSSVDGNNFELKAKLESGKYLEQYGDYFTYSPESE